MKQVARDRVWVRWLEHQSLGKNPGNLALGAG